MPNVCVYGRVGLYECVRKPPEGGTVSRRAGITAEKAAAMEGGRGLCVRFLSARIGEYEAGTTDEQRVFVAEHSQAEMEGRNLRGDSRRLGMDLFLQ